MEHSITIPELLALLGFFWSLVFVPAALVQWLLLRPAAARRLAFVLLSALAVEVLLAFAIWLSPLHHLFPYLETLGSLSFGSIPLQAALLAAAITTAIVWLLRRRIRVAGVAA